jgi:hypothetical protein
LSLAWWSANSVSMNFRDAAAIVLVGWYLMLPPHLGWKGSLPTFSVDAQLGKWKVEGSFDKASECDHELKRRIMDCGKCPLDSMWLSAQCVSTDDPRLKGK